MTLARFSVLVLVTAGALAGCNRPSQPPAPPPPVAEAPKAAPANGAQAKAASASGYSAAYDTCMASGDAAKGVTYAMQACIVNEMKIEDERLNTTYQTVMKGLDSAGQEKLRQAQRAWITVRDATCEANLTGGTIDRLNIPACRLDATIDRTKELKAMAPAD